MCDFCKAEAALTNFFNWVFSVCVNLTPYLYLLTPNCNISLVSNKFDDNLL